MGLRQRDWCRKQRDILRELLGGECNDCHTSGGRKNKLEFDVVISQGSKHHQIEWSHRISFYRRQYRNNNLQLLCQKCHTRKTNGENYDRTMCAMSDVF